MMKTIDPDEVRLRLLDRNKGSPVLEIEERYPTTEAGRIGELYSELLGPAASVDVEERDGETVVRASSEAGEREEVLAFSAAVAVNVTQRAGGLDHLRQQLARLDASDVSRGFD